MADNRKKISEYKAVEASRRVAQKARRRGELIASRIPGARAFLKPPEPGAVADRVVIISDVHLGEPHDLLAQPERVQPLVEAITELGPIDDLVILGDLFDFWNARFDEALKRGGPLLDALFTLPNVRRMVYLPGNHDHHIFRMYFEEKVARNLREGSLEMPELVMPMTRDCPAIAPLIPRDAQVPLFMTYPIYQVLVRGRPALLTHGHLLGMFERSLWKPKHSRISTFILNRTGSLDLDDMERFISPYYEMAMLSTYIPGVVENRYRIYRWLNNTGKYWGVSPDDRTSNYRGSTIEENAVEIEALLKHFCEEMPAYFVYGHTHRAGMLRLPLSGTLAVNSGCWLDDRGVPETSNTLVEITDDARIILVE
ncbi:MAG: metallophosphoesterase [Actinomycetota bacterium]